MINKETKKICKKHGLLKEEDISCYVNKKNSIRFRCKICKKKSGKKYYKKNFNKIEFKKKRSNINKKYRFKNNDKIKQKDKIRRNIECKNLSDTYIKNLLRTRGFELLITNSNFVDLTRILLILKRKIKDRNK